MKHGIKISFFAAALTFSAISPGATNIAPARAALVDTGYDACEQNGGDHCQINRNLLFRGNVPLDVANNYRFDPEAFRAKIFNYLQTFKQVYATSAKLPEKLDDLKNYRIVMVNLLYDGTEHGNAFEYALLTNEFKYSGAVNILQMPQQHKIYNLQSPFNPDSFAFEWWPVTMLGKDNHNGIPGAINWPEHDTVPVPNSEQNYLPMDVPYLVTGTAYADDVEQDAIDLRTLLTTQPKDGHPLLIFYHCYAGMDRTGAVTLSYLMSHGGYANVSDANHESPLTRSAPLSFQAALAATTNAKYPGPDDEALLAAKAYCDYSGKPAGECAGVVMK